MANYQWPAPPSAGTITINSEGINGGAAPTKSLQVAGKDGSGNIQPIKVSSAGVISVDSSASTQPVSQSGTWNITNISGTVSLPSGAATAAKQPALGTAGTASSDVITVQGITSMTALKTDGSAVTQPISAASLPLPSGAATAAKQPALGTAGTASSDVVTVQGITSMTALKVDGSAVTQPVSGTISVNQNGTWTVQPGNTANTTAWLVKEETSATGTTSSVAGSAASVQLLASNTSRKMGAFFNDSTSVLYLKLGTTASTTDYTVQIGPNAYYELPCKYTGRIDGIWASAAGNVRITELT